mmetsp:Transcript_20491/g.28625  ORF Transcript_20491/g.28625 Transcript_20491/m.28625 type:complete len:720 (-) Transcript_20491:197-2356(-)
MRILQASKKMNPLPRLRRLSRSPKVLSVMCMAGTASLTIGLAAISTFASAAGNEEISMEEVRKHTEDGNCWVVIDGSVYDVSEFMKSHPGGKRPLIENAGKDASKIFHHLHKDEILEQQAPEYKIGTVKELKEKDRKEKDLSNPENKVSLTYGGFKPKTGMLVDYIVVGAGSAGCLVAKRLAQEGYETLLLEAGDTLKGEMKEKILDPQQYGAALASTYNWGFSTEPQTHCGDRRLSCTRGRGIGGTSLLNGMLFNRGGKEIYDMWEEYHGAVGWNASNMLKYFKRYENNSRGESGSHGASGEVMVSDIPHDELSPIATAFVKACQQAGHPLNSDQNSLMASQLGVQLFQTYIRNDNGKRVTSGAFLKDADTVPLAVCPQSTVSEISLEESLGNQGSDRTSDATNKKRSKLRASGVKFVREDGSELHALARREVILSSGVIGSPHILMLSGVGPEKHLREKGIMPKINLPGVGENLVDHPRFACRWTSKLKDLNPKKLFSHIEGNLYIKSSYMSKEDPPDLQIQQGHVQTKDDLLTDPPRSTGFSLKPHLVRPFSKGTIRLNSNDPLDKPLIDPNYLSDERDTLRLVEGIKHIRNIVSQEAMASIRGKEVSPGPEVRTDEDLIKWVHNNVKTGYHHVGTCKIGKDEDPMAVLDANLLVRGTENLRVIDASAIPIIPNGNSQAATFAVAEKGSDLVLEQARGGSVAGRLSAAVFSRLVKE